MKQNRIFFSKAVFADRWTREMCLERERWKDLSSNEILFSMHLFISCRYCTLRAFSWPHVSCPGQRINRQRHERAYNEFHCPQTLSWWQWSLLSFIKKSENWFHLKHSINTFEYHYSITNTLNNIICSGERYMTSLKNINWLSLYFSRWFLIRN